MHGASQLHQQCIVMRLALATVLCRIGACNLKSRLDFSCRLPLKGILQPVGRRHVAHWPDEI